jgi:hypothetical protein
MFPKNAKCQTLQPARSDFDKNNLFVKEKHRMSLWPNYFTGLTFLSGALAIGATHSCRRGAVDVARR